MVGSHGWPMTAVCELWNNESKAKSDADAHHEDADEVGNSGSSEEPSVNQLYLYVVSKATGGMYCRHRIHLNGLMLEMKIHS